MDLLNFLLNPIKAKDICCLCYKKSENNTGLDDDVEIHDEYLHFNSSLRNIMKDLIPSHEFLLTQACEDCSTLILKMYSLLQRSYMKTEMLCYLIDNLDQEIEKIEYKVISENKPKKCKLKIKLPTIESIIYRQNNEDFECEKCQMKFKSKSLLRIHFQISHKNTNKAIICHICGKILKTSSLLNTHLSCHKQKQCPYCFKLLKSNSHFKIHLKNHISLVKIKRKHKHYDCANCDYRTVNKSTLEAHNNRVHLKIRPYACEMCIKTFYKKNHLVEHLATHKKIKETTCDVCGDTFASERTLETHLKLHTGEKPCKCDICGLNFISSSRKNEHIRAKHREKNECCVVCGKMFALKKYLNSHMKKVHSAEL